MPRNRNESGAVCVSNRHREALTAHAHAFCTAIIIIHSYHNHKEHSDGTGRNNDKLAASTALAATCYMTNRTGHQQVQSNARRALRTS